MRIFKYLGWDDHLSRLTLPHFDPTFTAIMLTMSALCYYQAGKGRLAQLFLPAIFLTYARSIWISLIFVGVAYSFQVKKYSKLILALILLLTTIMVLPKQFGEGTNIFRLFSIQSRLSTDITYVQQYGWDLFVGRGMNTLILDTQPSDLPNHRTSPNNSYLYLLTTTGVLGLVGWGMFLYSMFKKSAHKPMLIFFVVASLFNNVMFYPFALLWVLLLEATVPSEAE
jgi:O-antigen ligase